MEQDQKLRSQLLSIKQTAKETRNLKIYASMDKDGINYHLGDICGFSSCENPGKIRFVGQIEDIWTVRNIPRLVGLDVRWFYSKLDLPEKLKNLQFIAHSEVFPSNLHTSIYGEYLVCKVDIINEEQAINAQSISETQRMSRATYNRETCSFQPDIQKWKRICSCDEPFCIEAVYVQCSDCQGWFHNRKECTGMEPENVNKLTDFYCKECRKKLKTVNSRKKK